MSRPRVIGILYVLMALPAAFALQYVPRVLVVSGDATATAGQVRGSETLFRVAIASELVSAVLFTVVGVALYRLFRSVDGTLATLMLAFVIVSVPISFVAVMAELGALTLWSGADYLSVLGPAQTDALGYVLLRLHNAGIILAQVFWGLWLWPLALLTIRSGFVPRVVGALLLIAGAGYVAASAAAIIAPQFAALVTNVALIAEAGELSMIVWLLWTPSRDAKLVAAPVPA